MNNTEKLLPCPFCGQQPTEYAIEQHTHFLQFSGVKIPDHPGSHVIECACGCGMIEATREEVFAVWNRRPPQCLHKIQEPSAAEQAAWHTGLDEGRAQAAPAAVAVPDDREAFIEAWGIFNYPLPCNSRMHDDGSYAVPELQSAWERWQARAVLAATPAAAPNMVSVKQVDANKYCQILAALGMEEEGDPVAEVQNLQALAVTSILLDVVPGSDGMGHEVYATSVEDVVEKLSDLGSRLEDYQLGITAAPQAQADARDALTLAELLELRRAADDFNEGCDTDVEHDLLARGALAGYLCCERFVVLDGFALNAAIAAAKGEQQ